MVFLDKFYSLQSCYFSNIRICSKQDLESVSLRSVHQNIKLFIPMVDSCGSFGLWHYWLALSCEAEICCSNIFNKNNAIGWLVNSSLQSSKNIILKFKEWKIKHFKEAWTVLTWYYIFPEVRHYCIGVLTNGIKMKNTVTTAFSFCCSTYFVPGSGRVGQQSNCVNKPAILFSCVFRKKKNHDSEIGRLK